MSTARRTFYHSSNGDSWSLTLDSSGTVQVLHMPNVSSGGTPRSHEIGNFLSRERSSPQCQELVRLIGTLVEANPDA
jgi:hypothetical protein